jgi:hypothetical protein
VKSIYISSTKKRYHDVICVVICGIVQCITDCIACLSDLDNFVIKQLESFIFYYNFIKINRNSLLVIKLISCFY